MTINSVWGQEKPNTQSDRHMKQKLDLLILNVYIWITSTQIELHTLYVISTDFMVPYHNYFDGKPIMNISKLW